VLYLKCILVGIIAGFATAIACAAAWIFFAFQSIASSSEGGLGSVSVGGRELLLPWIAGFGIGFGLMLRRQRRRASV
jgi:hypothetical protein